MLERATRVCEAKFGTLLLYEGGGRFRVTATHGVPQAFAEARRRDPTIDLPSPAIGLGLLAASKQVVHHADLAKEWERVGKQPDLSGTMIIELGGARTFLGVPMLKDNELIGAMSILPPGGAAVHRQADRASPEFCRPSCHSDREYTAAQRTAPAHNRSYRIA